MQIGKHRVWALYCVVAFVVATTPTAWAGLFDSLGHVHAIAAGAQVSSLLIGAHDGIYRLEDDGGLDRVSQPRYDFMALAAAPGGVLYASGHPARGGNLGLVRSDDGGRTWSKVSDGLDGPVDFHYLAVSPSDGRVLYGVFKGLQRSADGGRSWERIGEAPQNLFHLAVSSVDPDRLYAATRQGLLYSYDQGRSWWPAHPDQAPATYVHADGGQVIAFIVGQGLTTKAEAASKWKVLANPFGGQVPVDLAQVGEREVALTNALKLLESRNGGSTWSAWGGDTQPEQPAARRGKALFEVNCQPCHGYRAMGETLVWDERANSLAPALDDSAHAWHHTDKQLVATILDGLPQGSGRMVGWRGRLSTDQARDIVAYLKTLWGPRALACQGPKHMQCM